MCIVALVLLNGLLSLTSSWPAIAVKPDARIAPEFIVSLVILCAWLALRGMPSPRVLGFFASSYALLVLGRYVDVVGPASFGRPVSLYWDIPQIPRFLWVTATGSPWWATLLVVAGSLLLVWLVYRGFSALFRLAAVGLAPYRHSPVLWLLMAALSGLAAANYAGVQATWPYVSKPVIPVYWKELVFLRNAFNPEKVAKLLPDQTVVEAALDKDSPQLLAALNNRDVMLMFLESYGAVLYDNEVASNTTVKSREALLGAIQSSGRQVVSAFFKSPTVGGGSDLAHMSLLSGIDLTNPRKHDLLLTTNRPNLLQIFQRKGYEVFGVYPSVFWDWPERVFYGFDTYLTGPDIEYTGPEFGFWKIPDQYVVAYLDKAYPRTGNAKPRLTMLSTMSTHFPFVPTPPYQADWEKLLGAVPFDKKVADKALAEEVDWTNMMPSYLKTINYTNTWLAGYFQQPKARESVYLLIGDHQPTATVTGENASWDVPVFVVSSDQALLDNFRQMGFEDGMSPSRKILGGLHDLTSILINGFSAQ